MKRRPKTTLRVLGTSVTLTKAIRERAAADLDLDLVFHVRDGGHVQRTGVLAPDQYDVYDQWFQSVDLLWPARALQPIELRRIPRWDEINPLPKLGYLPGAENHPTAGGGLPSRRLYLQPDGRLGPVASERVTMLPLTHNADSFAYRVDVAAAGSPDDESWAWLLDPSWSGCVGLQSDAAIGAIDAALAVQAAGLTHFEDVGNLALEEIDRLFDVLLTKKRQGHFRAFWSTTEEAAHLMISGRTTIESLWSPVTTRLLRAGVNYREAKPREGYRAWFGGLGISRCARGTTLDAAYDYLNWWLDGWPGAAMARQGYYLSNLNRVRAHLSAAEWDYWYEGQPAAQDLPGPQGSPLIPRGRVRDGGSYRQRMGRVAVWNSIMNEHNYLVRRWLEFLRS